MYERFRLMFPWVIVSLTTHLKTNSAWTVEHVASYLNGRLTLMPSVYWLHATVKVFSPKSGVSPRTKKDLGIKQLGFDNIDPQIHTHITVYVYIIIYIHIWATVKTPAILNMYSMDIGLWKLMEIVKNTRQAMGPSQISDTPFSRLCHHISLISTLAIPKYHILFIVHHIYI